MNETIHLTVLLENETADDRLVAEHGLSFCLQGEGWQTVFDTGQSGAFAENAGALGVDLSQTTELVLSHGHYDHTGGLPAFFDAVPHATVYAHPDVTLERYSLKDPNVPKRVGIPEESLRHLKQHGFEAVAHLTEVNETLRLSGPIPRNTDYEDVGGPFFLDAEGARADEIRDDQALWFVCDKGLVIVLGCAHAGVLNTIDLCQKQSGIEHIHAVIGGFHLVNADENRLTKTIAALQEIAPHQLAACHCTGAVAIERMKAAFPDSFTECHAGRSFCFSRTSEPNL